MELDDLRRQWRQPEPATGPPALSKAELRALLARQSGSIVAQLRRNAQWETNINYVLLVISLAVAWLAPVLWVRLFGGLLALIAVVCIFYFHQKARLLRSMSDPASDLRAHLLRLTDGLRALIRFYYRFTLATLPVACALMGFMAVSTATKAVTPAKIWLIGVVLAVLCVVLYLPMAHTTKRYLQWLYGQHLDRLEAQLHELDDVPRA
jgi:membrane protein YdbS with pleckstrin-like domain